MDTQNCIQQQLFVWIFPRWPRTPSCLRRTASASKRSRPSAAWAWPAGAWPAGAWPTVCRRCRMRSPEAVQRSSRPSPSVRRSSSSAACRRRASCTCTLSAAPATSTPRRQLQNTCACNLCYVNPNLSDLNLNCKVLLLL